MRPQLWPAGTYENVKLVWTGSGSYATAGGCKNVLPLGRHADDRQVGLGQRQVGVAGRIVIARGVVHAPRRPRQRPRRTAPARTTSAPGTNATAAVPTAMTAKAKGHRVSGTLATATGKRISGARVTLQRRTASGWTKVTSKRTGDHGAVRYHRVAPQGDLLPVVLQGRRVPPGGDQPRSARHPLSRSASTRSTFRVEADPLDLPEVGRLRPAFDGTTSVVRGAVAQPVRAEDS